MLILSECLQFTQKYDHVFHLLKKEIGYFVFHHFQWDLFLGLSGMQECNQCESIFNDNIHFDNPITNF